jgi:2-polyprenyl-6-methoxyphenol hydroxylase-like FAD-dependent oxidoreductase
MEDISRKNIVIVGGGPVGLWTAIQLKRRRPDLEIRIYERYETYQRSHVLRLEHLSMLLYGKNSRAPGEQAFQ